MCSGYPVIRCSGFAKIMLKRAEVKQEEAETFEEKELAGKLIRKAEDLLYTTPAGFTELEEKIAALPEGLEKDALWNRLIRGKQERRKTIVENNRLQRINASVIEKGAELSASNMPRWVVASQLALDEIERNKNCSISSEGENFYTINKKNKNCVVALHDGEKVLVAANKYSFPVVVFNEDDEIWEKSVTGKVISLVEEFAGRGVGEVIEEYELTSEQKEFVWEAVVQKFTENGLSSIMLCEPKNGVILGSTLDTGTLSNTFELVLHSPTFVRNGTDPLNNKSVKRFMELFDPNFLVSSVENINGKYIIETKNSLTEGLMNVENEFILKHLQENFYEVKKLGRVRETRINVTLKVK